MKRERKKLLQILGEDAACKMLGWRLDLMARHCVKQPIINGRSGHNVIPEARMERKPKRRRKNYD